MLNKNKIIIHEKFTKNYKEIRLEEDYIGFHIVYFECGECQCGVTHSNYDDAKKEYEETKEML